MASERKQEKAIAIMRVSSEEQEKGTSLQTQEGWVELVTKERNLNLVHVIKETMSGEEFPKKYFDEIIELAKRENIDYIIFYSADRFSRSLPYGSSLLESLSEEGVKVLTGNGEYNLQDSSDRTSIWVSLLCAEFEQGIRNRKITDAAIDILKRGGIPHKPPFGCERIDSEVRLKDGYKEVIRLVFETFIQKKSYQGTARIVNEKYGEDMGFELDRDAVARIVTNTIYTGFVYWDGMYFGQDGSSDKPNEDLRAVDEETFERAQAVVAEIAQKYSRNPGPSHRVRQLAIEHGADVVLENLNVRVSCPKCDSTDLQHNGQDNIIINGTLAWKFKCKNCPHSFRFPAAKQLKQLASLNPLRCMKCGSADKFAVEKEEGGERLTCEECGFSVFLEGDNEHVPERKPINNNETEKDSASSDKGEKIKANTASKDNQTPNNNSDRDQITNTTLELFFE